ncbi:MAG: Uma2 family endonuclease [Chlorogloeopsis fritschii C42_A2020_084]|uniref:Uma2 family endonuclease n=1 Tax=Chlorogloeopsis fritschii TaxID=1124 RepID=UPI0019FD4BAD|nr:Uma2 family endonuclease [Chlorogloeopsis fritschii]MBF2004222.1 Uma2 family endonuclease [Chlorogloeopsis fritschii C42_A2020_084]
MTVAANLAKSLPLLENGDRLTRDEFERRYHAMPDLKKAELIEGVVYVPSPLRYYRHGRPHAHIMAWLGLYSSATPGVEFADNATVRLDLDNEPQPDALLRIEEACGGRSRISEDDYVEGAPELIVEIASSSASYDLHDKLKVYRRNGVQEYIVWQMAEQKLDWFSLQGGEYIPLQLDESNLIRSRIFPGLDLPIAALLTGDLATVLAQVQKSMITEAHQGFVELLKQRRSPSTSS